MLAVANGVKIGGIKPTVLRPFSFGKGIGVLAAVGAQDIDVIVDVVTNELGGTAGKSILIVVYFDDGKSTAIGKMRFYCCKIIADAIVIIDCSYRILP